MLLHMAISESVEIGIPLPDAHVMDHGGRHRLACRVEACGDQTRPHDPPRVIVLSLVLICYRRSACEPFMPVPSSLLHNFSIIRNIAIEAKTRGNIQQ